MMDSPDRAMRVQVERLVFNNQHTGPNAATIWPPSVRLPFSFGPIDAEIHASINYAKQAVTIFLPGSPVPPDALPLRVWYLATPERPPLLIMPGGWVIGSPGAILKATWNGALAVTLWLGS